jgi:hypothetical protein
VYIFFCSAIPALAFGEQLVIETGGPPHNHLTNTAANLAAPIEAQHGALTCRWDSFGGARSHRHSTGRRLAGSRTRALGSMLPTVCTTEDQAQSLLCHHRRASAGAELLLLTCITTSRPQAVVGGQPLLIVGVAEPIVLIYGYMYNFARDKPDLGEPGRPGCVAIGNRRPAMKLHHILLPNVSPDIARATRWHSFTRVAYALLSHAHPCL